MKPYWITPKKKFAPKIVCRKNSTYLGLKLRKSYLAMQQITTIEAISILSFISGILSQIQFLAQENFLWSLIFTNCPVLSSWWNSVQINWISHGAATSSLKSSYLTSSSSKGGCKWFSALMKSFLNSAVSKLFRK